MIEKTDIEINARPEFLDGLEYDIYFPLKKSAFEFNGDQHYVDTDTFGSCTKQKERDGRKRYLSRKNGIKLITVDACHLRHETLLKLLYSMGFKHVRQLSRKNKDALILLDSESSAYRLDLIGKFPNVTTVYSHLNRRRKQADSISGRYDKVGYKKGRRNWSSSDKQID